MDNAKILTKAMQHDTANWKVARITRNEKEQLKVIELMRHYFLEIKEIFVCAVAEYGTPPDLCMRDVL